MTEMVLEWDNKNQVCDWINGEPDAWHQGYTGRAYPDLFGIEIPLECVDISLGDKPVVLQHTYVRYGDTVIKNDETGELSVVYLTRDNLNDRIFLAAPHSGRLQNEPKSEPDPGPDS